MKIMGLDVATKTGWAVINGNDMRAGHFTAKGEDDHLLADFRRQVIGLLCAEKPDFVAIEAPMMMVPRMVEDKAAGEDSFGKIAKKFASNPKTDARLQQLNGIAGMCCVERSIPLIRVNVATHTKAFLGAGRIPAGKRKEMTLAQCQRIGIKITNKDAADAVSVAWFGAGHMRQSIMLGADLFKGAAE